jgi:hypothetical protein
MMIFHRGSLGCHQASPVETSSKVVADPLANGDPQVTLSHVECLPQALALDPARPLVALRISLY